MVSILKQRKIRLLIAFILILTVGVLLGCKCAHKVYYEKEIRAPTCTSSGVINRVCEKCEEVLDVIELPMAKHSPREEETKTATCISQGIINNVCKECNEILAVIKTPMLEHSFGEYSIIEPAKPNQNGLQSAKCASCSFVDLKEYICQHASSFERKVDASCIEAGVIETVCEECETVLNRVDADTPLGHDYPENWRIMEYAIPEQNGVKERACLRCESIERKEYAFEMKTNSIYIPNTNINAKFVPCKFNQANCDAYDLIYTKGFWGTDAHWILGHSTGTMGYLSQVNVGNKIYIDVNGQLYVFEVQISEFGMQNESWTDIALQSSGDSLFSDVGYESLRMYTCYGDDNGRWCVIAKQIG